MSHNHFIRMLENKRPEERRRGNEVGERRGFRSVMGINMSTIHCTQFEIVKFIRFLIKGTLNVILKKNLNALVIKYRTYSIETHKNPQTLNVHQ